LVGANFKPTLNSDSKWTSAYTHVAYLWEGGHLHSGKNEARYMYGGSFFALLHLAPLVEGNTAVNCDFYGKHAWTCLALKGRCGSL
jgi:hypothetical protein